MNNPPTIIITGAGGFIGSALVSYFSNSDFQVRAFLRNTPEHNNSNIIYHPFELSDVLDRGFEGADYLIHCAHEFKTARNNKNIDVNIPGTQKIISLCRKYGIKSIFISTLAAHNEAESEYGKIKLQLEGLFDLQQDLIIKPGLVLGEGGLFARISNVLKHHKIVPLVGGGKQFIQIIGLDDLVQIIDSGIKKNLCGKFKAAHPEPISMKGLYEEVARLYGSRPLFIPVPISIAYRILKMTEALGLSLPVTSENVLGLKHLKVFDTENDLQIFGIKVKNYREALHELSRN